MARNKPRTFTRGDMLVGTLLAAFVCGVTVRVILKNSITYQYGKTAAVLLEECQAELPRNQYCELTAKPIPIKE